jgi:hypothetical protein
MEGMEWRSNKVEIIQEISWRGSNSWKKYAREFMEEKHWRRNHGGEMMKETSWRRTCGGEMTKHISWRRYHRGGKRKETSLGRNTGGEIITEKSGEEKYWRRDYEEKS